VDSSGSIRDNQPPGIDNWGLIASFLSDIVSTYLTVGVLYDRVAVVVFSATAQIVFDFNKYLDQQSVLNALQKLPFIGYETNTPQGLALARQLFTDPTSGVRQRSAKVMVLCTDGNVTDTWSANYQPEIDRIKAIVPPIVRYAVGVTTAINEGELLAFSGGFNAYTTVLSFQDLPTVRAGLGAYIGAVNCNGSVVLTSLMTSAAASTTTARGSSTSLAVPTSSSSGSRASSSTSGGSTVSSAASAGSSTASSAASSAPTSASPAPFTGEGCFGAVRNATATGNTDPLPFPTLLANRNNAYVTLSNSFVSLASNGFYFIEICAGASQGTSAELDSRGAFPPLGYAWRSTAQNDVVSNCRNGVLSMTRGVRVTITQVGGGSYSDANIQTTWSMFDINDVISAPSSILFATYGQVVSAPAPIPFINPISNPPGQYDSSKYEYSCQAAGVFFFGISVGVAAGQSAQIQLTGMDKTFELIRASTIHTGDTTLSRCVIAQCPASGRVSVQVLAGQIAAGSGPVNLISFVAFPYALKNTTQLAAWGLYRTTSLATSSSATDPLPFDSSLVSTGVTVNSNAVTLTTGGYYYVQICAGAPAGQKVQLSLKLNGATLFNVYRAATNDNGLDTLCHGMVVLFKSSDVLKAVNEANSALYSTPAGLHTAFIGMLLYPA